MKKLCFAIILIFNFCYLVFSQTSDSICPNIIIKAPIYVYTETTFDVSAGFEKVDSSDTSKFNWIIINKDRVIKVKNEKSVKVTAGNVDKIDEAETIIVLAESLDENCRDTAMARIVYFPHFGSPHVIDQYEELKWKDEKIRLDIAVIETDRNKDTELLIFVKYNDKLLKEGVKIYLSRRLDYLTSRGLKKDQVTFLTEYSETKETKLQLFPKELDVTKYYNEYLIIKGEDLEKLAKLF